MLTLRDRKIALHHLAFSLDGEHVAAAGIAGVVRVWELATQQLALRISTHKYWNTEAVLFMPDGDEVLVLAAQRLNRFTLRGERLGYWPRGHNHDVFAAAVSPDGKRLVLGVNPYRGALQQFSLPDFEPLWKQSAHLNGQVSALACSRDGRFVACGLGSGAISVCGARTGLTVHRLDGASSVVKAVALSPDGRYVAWCAATQLHLWRLDPPEQILRHSIGRTFFHSVAFHPSGNFLATGNGDGKVDYWSTGGEALQAFDWGVGRVNGVIFDSSGDRAACCSQTGEVVVWDVDR